MLFIFLYYIYIDIHVICTNAQVVPVDWSVNIFLGRIFLNLILVYIILFIGIWLNPVQIYSVSFSFFILLVCLLIYFLCIIVWLVSEVSTVNMLKIVFQKKRLSIRFRLGPAKTVFSCLFVWIYIACLLVYISCINTELISEAWIVDIFFYLSSLIFLKVIFISFILSMS